MFRFVILLVVNFFVTQAWNETEKVTTYNSYYEQTDINGAKFWNRPNVASFMRMIGSLVPGEWDCSHNFYLRVEACYYDLSKQWEDDEGKKSFCCFGFEMEKCFYQRIQTYCPKKSQNILNDPIAAAKVKAFFELRSCANYSAIKDCIFTEQAAFWIISTILTMLAIIVAFAILIMCFKDFVERSRGQNREEVISHEKTSQV